MHKWSVNLQQRSQEYTMGIQVSSITGVGKPGQPHEKE